MIMEWFRWDSVTTTDTVYQVIARSAKVKLGDVILTLISIAEFSAQRNTKGCISGFSDRGNDLKWGFSDGTTARILAEFKAEKILKNNRIVKWKDQQTQFRAEYMRMRRNSADNDDCVNCVTERNTTKQDKTVQDKTELENTSASDNSELSLSAEKNTDCNNSRKRGPQPRDDANAEFNKFWDLYPKKKDKAEALKAWRATPPSKRESFIRAARIYAADCKGQEQQYIKYPATFLRRVDPTVEFLEPSKRGKVEYNTDGSFGEARELTAEEEARLEELALIGMEYEANAAASTG